MENVPKSILDTGVALQDTDTHIKPEHDWRFKTILASLSVTALLSALEATIVSTALPTIVKDLALGENYIWVINAFLLASTACLPMIGQLADIWGRRWLTIGSVATFLLGSGISGGATSGNMLIAGRTLQGLGGGAINLLIELIVVDLVPLRERGKYMAIIFGVFAIGTGIGPVIGGLIVQRTTWRWVFYLNLPVGGAALALLVVFLQVGYKKQPTRQALTKIDYVGNFLIVTSTISILFALAYGGTIRPWSSWRIIVPLVLGFGGIMASHAYMASRWCRQPTIPPRLFLNRTSAVGFVFTFLHALLFVWVIYFLPVYFQGVLVLSPSASGVHLLPTVLVLIPFAAVGGGLLSTTGRYRPLVSAGFLLITMGMALFVLLNSDSSTGLWVGLQIVYSAGAGLVLPALLPIIQSSLDAKDNAASTATFTYIRSYGAIWGATIPAAIFNNQVSTRLARIADAELRTRLSGGDAYAAANAAFIHSLPANAQDTLVGIFQNSLRVSWIVGAAIAGVGTLLILLLRHVELRTEQETDFGLTESS